jgi:hypothetical protein
MFKSVLNAYRVIFKPGVVGFSNAPGQLENFPTFTENTNADPLCDGLGNQWVRDASDPQAFRDPANSGGPSIYRFPTAQVWDYFPNAIQTQQSYYFIGLEGGIYYPLAIYQIVASAFGLDDGAMLPWDSYKLYLQIFAPNSGVQPSMGDIPQFSTPIDVPPNRLVYEPGVKTPFNAIAGGNSGGACIALSTIMDTYNEPNADTFDFVLNVSWAFYNYQLGV